MSESNVGVSEVEVGAANAGVGHLKENIIGAKFSGNSLANRGLALSTAVDVEGNLAAHSDCVGVVLYKVERLVIIIMCCKAERVWN